MQKITETFRAFPEIEEAILYGSRAIGTFKTGSDIDISLKGHDINHGLLNKISLALDDLLLPYEFDVSLLSQISNPDLVEHIQRVGISFYKR